MIREVHKKSGDGLTEIASIPETVFKGSPRENGQEASLSRQEQEWQNIFDTLTDMITIHDRDFKIVRANKAAEKILGLPLLTAAKAKCFKFYHGSEFPPDGCPSCSSLRTGEPAFFEMYEPHLKMYIEIRAIPRCNDSGQLIGLIHIVRDITGRKLIEEELDIHRRHLEFLVTERTKELTSANEQLQLEVAERKRAEKEKEGLIMELQDALAKIKTLRGLLSMCAWCNKIRDERGNWRKVEVYIKEHSDASFTHGICPDCLEKCTAKLSDQK